MLDDSERFISNPGLVRLLAHYVQAGVASPETWQNRLDELESTEPKEMVKLHGWLLGRGWLELNVGAVPSCYRATPAGRRALRRPEVARAGDDAEEQAA